MQEYKKFNNSILKFLISAFVIFSIMAALSACKGKTDDKAASKGDTIKVGSEVSTETGLKILKSDLSENAKFYGYKAGDTYMEVVAVKAKDGSIKTALNTCQVCYSSGRGYYKQEGDTLVCQNCGNVFNITNIGKAKNGCNPVPIDSKARKEDDSSIEISRDFLEKDKALFANWKK